MKIAFWGGCINRQYNIAPDKHYHALVRRAIGLQTGVAPKTWLRFYSSFHEMQRDTLALLNGDAHYDYLVIFLRPFTLMPLTKPLIRYTDKTMQTKLALNPRFSNRKYYDDMVKEYKVVTGNKESNGFLHKAFQRLNDLAGDMLGLQEWSRKEVMEMLGEVHATASEKRTELILLGPPPYPSNMRINNCCIELNRQIAGFARDNNIVHVDMSMGYDKEGNPLSAPDGKHVSEAGHAFMAQGIIKYLQLQFEKPVAQVVE
jgi:hypothetical protein